MNWIEMDSQQKKFAACLRTAGINEEGMVFASAALTGNEQNAVLRASWDGVQMAIYRGHVFLPTTWLVRDCPEIELLCEKITDTVRAANAG